MHMQNQTDGKKTDWEEAIRLALGGMLEGLNLERSIKNSSTKINLVKEFF